MKTNECGLNGEIYFENTCDIRYRSNQEYPCSEGSTVEEKSLRKVRCVKTFQSKR